MITIIIINLQKLLFSLCDVFFMISACVNTKPINIFSLGEKFICYYFKPFLLIHFNKRVEGYCLWNH